MIDRSAQCTLSEAKQKLRLQTARLSVGDSLRDIICRHPLAAVIVSSLGGAVAARTLPRVARVLIADPGLALLLARFLIVSRRR